MACRRQRAVRGDGGEPLVVHLDDEIVSGGGAQLVELGADAARGRSLIPRQRDGQSDDDAVGAGFTRRVEDGAVVGTAITRPFEHGHRAGERAGRIRSRETDPALAQIHSEHAAHALRLPRLGAGRFLGPLRQQGARFLDGGRIRPTADGNVGLTARPTTEGFGCVARDRARLHPALHEVLADGDRHRRLVTIGRETDQADDARAERVARRDRELAELVVRQPVTPLDHDAVDRGRRERGRLGGRLLALLRLELAAQRLELGKQALDPVADLRRRDIEPLRRVAQRVLFVEDVLECDIAGHRLDAAQVGPDRAFAHDLDRPDEAERVHVGATAQLDGVLTRLQHSHDVTVLVAEEGDGTEGLRLVFRGLVMPNRGIGDDLAVRKRLHRLHLLRRDRLVVAEVESQPLGRDQ